MINTKYTVFVFVNNSLGMKRGKIAGQVGHACMRIGAFMPKGIYHEYIRTGERKIVLKAKELPSYYMGGILEDTVRKMLLNDREMIVSAVKDHTLKEFTVMAIFTTSDFEDTEEYRLL